MEKADQLLDVVEATGSDAAANQLLNEFFRGYPLRNLERLLESDKEHSVKAGIWIASELGSAAGTLLPMIARLLTHHSRYVRFVALDSVLLNAGAGDAAALAAAVSLLRDPDDAVRWKSLQFLTRASPEQLNVSVMAQADAELATLTTWLVGITESPLRDTEIEQRLFSESSLTRIFAVCAAARAGKNSHDLLHIAASSSDTDVLTFAEEQLKAFP